jgi:hypothetical protein
MSEARPLRLFNLDLHVSVIADFESILKQLYGNRVELTQWSISGHTWVFGKQPTNVHVITQDTWTDLNEEMIENFHEIYGDFLETFDAFIVTHTPVFCRLYERYNKPVILINTCRYEQPYCWTGDIHQWLELHECLHRLQEAGHLFAVSNNKADQAYLRLGAEVDSVHIPSLCDYTGVKWSPCGAEPLLYTNEQAVPPIESLVRRADLPKPFQWSDLMMRKAIVHVPYEISTMSIAEQLAAGVPLFFPTKQFLYELWRLDKIDFQGPYAREVPIPVGLQEPLDSPDAHMWWLDRADYYDEESMKVLNYFSSWEDLNQKLANFEETPEQIHQRFSWLKKRKESILDAWATVLRAALKIERAAPSL